MNQNSALGYLRGSRATRGIGPDQSTSQPLGRSKAQPLSREDEAALHRAQLGIMAMPASEEQARLLEDALSVVRQQTLMMRRCLETPGKLMDALKCW